jgi:hypothetical protein
MDKVVILGVYNFVGFQMCKSLLDNGIEVSGVSIGDMERTSYHDEKRLEVGRNANFSEYTLTNLVNEGVDPTTKRTVILSLYDFYMLGQERTLLNDDINEKIIGYMSRFHSQPDTAVILPIQLLQSDYHLPLDGLTAKLKEQAGTYQEIYLPTIYGPWQPSVFLFQQAILSSINKGKISGPQREWLGDALFVEDAVETMIDILETGKPGEFLLESGKDNYWQLCADYLKIEPSLTDLNNEHLISRDIVRMPVKNVTALADSFAKQRDHTRLLFQNQD